MTKKLVQFMWWSTNIGNDFINLGTQYMVEKAIEQSEMDIEHHLVSSYLYNILNMTLSLSKKDLSKKVPLEIRKKIPKKIRIFFKKNLFKLDIRQYNSHRVQNSWNIIEFVKADYYVIPGMLFDPTILRVMEKTLLKFSYRGKIMLLGVGGETYSQKEMNKTVEILKKIKPYVLISRDKKTFQAYGSYAEHAYNGVDMGFYLKKLYKPIKIEEKYIVFCFDKVKAPQIETKYPIINTHHYVRLDMHPELLLKYLKEKNLFLSDNPYDYLILYANANEVHTDRVHACVASMTYDTPCRLYYKTARARLFFRLGVDPYRSLSIIDQARLYKELDSQLKFFAEILRRD